MEQDTQALADGSSPLTEDALLQRLDELGIDYALSRHAPVRTVAEAKVERGDMTGAHIKNLFLRNKKGYMWLVTCHEDRQIDLKTLGQLVGAGRLSFASPERLMGYLGVLPGAVTPLAIVNDRSGAVQVVLDQAILGDRTVNVHPLHNAATLSVSPAALVSFLETEAHAPTILDMEAFSHL